MNEQDFAHQTCIKYRQKFAQEFCQDGVAYLWNGSFPRKNFLLENQTRDLSSADAVWTALKTLSITLQFFTPDEAAVLLFLYKQIILRTERQRRFCFSTQECKKINDNHRENLLALKEAIAQRKKIPAHMDWIARALIFFRDDKLIDLNEIFKNL